MFTKQACGIDFGAVAILQGAFQNMRQKKPRALKLRMNLFRGPCREGDSQRPKQVRRFSAKVPSRRVQIVRVLARGNRSQQKGLDMHGPVPSRPFETP